MKTNNKATQAAGNGPPMVSILGLKGRQSVRVTFSLTEGCIDAISIVANQMGIKQKSIFDYLTEDSETLMSITGEIKQNAVENKGRIKKTYIINRKSLDVLDRISHSFSISRDAFIEYSIQKLLPLIDQEREKHDKRKVFLFRMRQHFEKGEKLLTDIRQELGDDDPILSKFSAVMAGYEAAKADIEKFIHKSTDIEDFDSNNFIS
jgi:hypothetical protein